MNDQQEAGIPTLVSIYTDKWSGDVSADADYSETDSERDSDVEDFDGSSDEWEGDSDPEMATEEDEEVETDSEEGQDIELTEDQLDMLQKHVSEFRAADLPRRFTISGWQSEAAFNRMKGQKTYRDIVMDVYRKELHTMALSMSDSKAGSAEYLGCYQKALKTVLGGLTEEAISKYKAQAKRWTEDRLPPQQQRRMMEKHSKSTFRQFAQYVYDQFGMWIAIFTAYCDAEGDPVITFFDINDQLGAPSFKSRHEDWTSEPMFQDFSKWAGECFGQQPNDSDEETPKRSKDVPPEIKLKTDTQGYPMLPSWESIKDAELKYKKYLIGRYLTEMHCGGKGRIPWTQLRQAQGNYILQEYLPAGVTLTQYHHIRLGDANALLQHWTTRQAAGQIPFHFKDVAKTSQHSEPALRRGGVSANISHGNGEEDPDGIQGAQEQGSEHDNNFQGGDKCSDNNDAQGGGNAANDLGPSTHSLPHNCLTPGRSRCSGRNRGAKGCVELLTEDGTDPAPPLINQPYSPNNGSQLDIAAESVMRKTWSNKFNFLALLSKDGKYHELLQEINQMLLSDHIIYISPSIHHPAWAYWTWAKAWLSEAFHSGGEKPVWQWLQSRPYAHDPLQEGVSGDVSVDGIALAIGYLLRDIGAVQFPDKFYHPQHVTHSTVSFDVIGTIIHPALDDFIQIVRDRNHNITADDGHMLPAAPVSTDQEP
ncbi:hypothetical protein EI94DRAFT_1704942 [Lactarius quietus]|nr:hypothetical protein EI94DRAFT_1704942 [Lactarius quietus]